MKIKEFNCVMNLRDAQKHMTYQWSFEDSQHFFVVCRTEKLKVSFVRAEINQSKKK